MMTLAEMGKGYMLTCRRMEDTGETDGGTLLACNQYVGCLVMEPKIILYPAHT